MAARQTHQVVAQGVVRVRVSYRSAAKTIYTYRHNGFACVLAEVVIVSAGSVRPVSFHGDPEWSDASGLTPAPEVGARIFNFMNDRRAVKGALFRLYEIDGDRTFLEGARALNHLNGPVRVEMTFQKTG